MKTAVLIGASGLIGNFLLYDLLAESSYQKVIILVRKLLPIEHYKLTQVVTDFADENILKANIIGDDLFICTGTTIKKAGSKEAFKAIDWHLPFSIAQVAKQNSIQKVLLVSASGANEKSLFFYGRIKGFLENSLQKLNLPQLIIFRPSLLLGNRKEKRLAEKIFQKIFFAISFLFIGKLKKYKGIEAQQVAKKMNEIAQSSSNQKVIFFENNDLFQK
ncbi:MAG: hypothetical protein RIQ33_2112 [Bacteroidota bacterium]|jgi:uncharacterized protein YbjT (DUF2867 family)